MNALPSEVLIHMISNYCTIYDIVYNIRRVSKELNEACSHEYVWRYKINKNIGHLKTLKTRYASLFRNKPIDEKLYKKLYEARETIVREHLVVTIRNTKDRSGVPWHRIFPQWKDKEDPDYFYELSKVLPNYCRCDNEKDMRDECYCNILSLKNIIHLDKLGFYINSMPKYIHYTAFFFYCTAIEVG